MNILKQSTTATIKLGPFIDDTDGKTAETALSIAQADVRLSKNGGDFAQKNSTTSATHDENGYYDISLDATDTGTLGRLRVSVSKSGALPVWQDFQVVTANVYDTLCSTDSLDVTVTALANDVIKAASFDESTAFPLKSADTGTTQIARVGADGDTLETLSDEIATVKTDTAAILVDTGTTLDGLIKDVPTVSEFEARTLPSTNYALEATLAAIRGAGGDTLESLSNEIATKMASTEVIEGTYTLKDAIRIILAFAAGKVSGGGTASIKFRSTGDDVDRIQATVDSSGNRTAVTLNPNDPI